MKIIYPEKQTGTGSNATSENDAFPVSNLFDDKPGKLWKAADSVQAATLRIAIAATADVVSLFKTNTTSAICTITLNSAEQTIDNAAVTDEGGGVVGIPLTGHGYNTGDQILLNGTVNYDGVYTVLASSVAGRIDITANYVAETFAGTETACIIIETTTHTLSGTRTYDRFWQEYTSQGGAHTATIKLTTTATTIQAGVVKAGVAADFKNPRYGISEYPIDYSTVEELSNGAKYVKSKDIVRGFNVTVNVVRASDFYNLWDIIVAYGRTPMAALMAEDIIDSQWCVFGTIESFSGTHQYPIDSVVSLTFEEVI